MSRAPGPRTGAPPPEGADVGYPLDRPAGQREPEADAAGVTRAAGVHAVETLEDPLAVDGRDAGTGVAGTDVVVLGLQPLAQGAGHFSLVLDHQDAHVAGLAPRRRV